MTASRATTRTTRFGLLIVAVVHILTAATLSFTHGHIPSRAGDHSAIAGAEEGHGGQPPGHADVCVICQAVGSAHVSPAASRTFIDPVHALAGAEYDSVLLPALRTYSSASPRSPPRG